MALNVTLLDGVCLTDEKQRAVTDTTEMLEQELVHNYQNFIWYSFLIHTFIFSAFSLCILIVRQLLSYLLPILYVGILPFFSLFFFNIESWKHQIEA